MKTVASSLGFCPDMKEYKKDPGAYKGSVGDISMFLRLAVTGRQQSPDMWEIIRIIGEDRMRERIGKAISELEE